MKKVEVIPSLERQIAIVEARNREDEARDMYKVKRSRRMKELAVLIIPAALFYLDYRFNIDALGLIGSCVLLGFTAEYLKSFIRSRKELNNKIDDIYNDESFEAFKKYNDIYLKNRNQTKLFMGKYKRELENSKNLEITDSHKGISKGELKHIIKRNEANYYKHYNLPDYLIFNDEYNAIVNTLYSFLEENYPDINKEDFIIELFRLMYAEALVNNKEEITSYSILDALYYQDEINERDLEYLAEELDERINQVLRCRDYKVVPFNKKTTP